MSYRRLFCITPLIALFALVVQAQNRSQLSERPNLIQSFAALPMGFEENQGQAEDSVRFLARGAGYSVYLSRGGMLLAFDSRNKAKPELVRINLANANQEVEPQGTDLLPGITNYYVGNDSAKWQTGVRQFRKVAYRGIYSGVDLVFYGNHRQLEFDFDVAPGVDPSRIALKVDGASIRKTKDDLEVITPSGKVAWLKKPELYQGDGKARHRVLGGYHLRSASEVVFRVGKYDTRQALVIDPALIYSTLIGGPLDNMVPFSIAVDSSGAAYITGQTFTPGPLPVAFVLKFDPTGSTLVYETRIGGTIEKFNLFCSNCVRPNTPAAGFGIAVDASGNAYTAGITDEVDFPVTAGAFSTNSFCTGNNGNVGCMEPFAAKLDPNGKLVFSTFLVSASAVDTAGPVPSSIAIDASGSMYVTGTTAQQVALPIGVLTVGGLTTTAGAFQTSRNASNHSSAFVLKLHPDGSKVDYATYLGGSTGETSGGIAVDSSGTAYVDGGTSSADFPVTAGASLTTNPGTAAFFSKLKADGSGLIYSTFLAGPNGQAEGTSIAIDSALSAYLGGMTATSFPTRAVGLPSMPAFAAKFNSSGTLIYSTLLNSQMTYELDSDFFGDPPQSSIAVDSTGAAYVGTGAGGFINSTITVSKLNATGSLVSTATVGPINTSFSRFGGFALDSQQNFYITGVAGTLTTATGEMIPDIGTTVGAFQTVPEASEPNPQEIMFAQKYAQSLGSAVAVPNPRLIAFPQILQQGQTSNPNTVMLFNYGDADLAISGINIGGANASDFAIPGANNTCGSTVHANQNCSFQVTFTPTVGVGSRTGTVNLSFGGGLSSQTVALSAAAGTPVFQANPTTLNFGDVVAGQASQRFDLIITNTGTGPMHFPTPGHPGQSSW